MTATYDRRSGQYRGSDGKFVGRAKILQLLDSESARLEVRLQAHARLLTSNKISVAEFQERMAEDIKLSHLRSGLLGAGGKSQASNRHYGTIGQLVRQQYQFLDRFGKTIAAGELSEKQILARAKSYGISTRSAFFAAEKVTKRRQNYNQAKRTLDSSVRQHCAECLNYSTGGRWVPIEQVVAPGVGCSCSSRCACFVAYRRFIA